MPGIAKTPCPVTREQFEQNAAPELTVTIDGKALHAEKREFNTGTLGWYLSQKISVDVGGVKVPCQVQVSVMAANSKELPRE
jgi:hypothetical protein